MASKKRDLTKTEKRTETLAAQTQKKKTLLLEQLEKYPIVQVACERAGVGRATYYLWRDDDKAFMKSADIALSRGTKFINDLAESKLIRAIQDGHMTAIIYWLKNHNGAYSDKIQHKHLHEIMSREVDPEQIALIKQAMGNFATKIKKNKRSGIANRSWDPRDYR